jgi:hypothetical protein
VKSRILLPLLFLTLPFGLLTAHQNPDSKQDPCALFNRLKTMSLSEFMNLLARAQAAGDAAAQYQVGNAYEIGGPVSRDYDVAANRHPGQVGYSLCPPLEVREWATQLMI